MSGRRLALVVVLAGLHGSSAWAQAPEGEAPDIDMEPAPEEGAPEEAPVAADPPPVVKDPKLAKKLAHAALQFAKKGDYLARKKKPDDAKAQYEEAANAYTKAIELGDDLNLYYDLAAIEEKLGKLDLAVKHLRVVVKAEADSVKPDILKKATEKRDDLLMQVGVVRLVIEPETTVVSLGGAELGAAPLPEPLILMPGTYTLSFAADGYQPKDLEINVEAGSEAERKIELEPIKVVVAPIEERPDEPIVETPPTPPNKLPLYVGAGVAGGTLVIGIVTGIVAVAKHGTFTSPDATVTEREDARSSGQSFALVSDIALGTAVAAGAFTAYWYFFKYRPAQAKLADEARPTPSPEMSKVHLVPWVQPVAGGLTSGLGITASF